MTPERRQLIYNTWDTSRIAWPTEANVLRLPIRRPISLTRLDDEPQPANDEYLEYKLVRFVPEDSGAPPVINVIMCEGILVYPWDLRGKEHG